MAEYIEREAVLAMKYGGLVDVVDIKTIPAADVAPVVRCKDCKHFGGHGIAIATQQMETERLFLFARTISAPTENEKEARADG